MRHNTELTSKIIKSVLQFVEAHLPEGEMIHDINTYLASRGVKIYNMFDPFVMEEYETARANLVSDWIDLLDTTEQTEIAAQIESLAASLSLSKDKIQYYLKMLDTKISDLDKENIRYILK